MKLSRFGTKLTSRSGILSLMDDLGSVVASGRDILMLGGGNPGRIPSVQRRFRERMERILASPGELERMVGSYGPPAGDPVFRRALAALLSRELGWPIGIENVALTNGSQSGFFMLFNMFAGEYPDGPARKILLPLTPEYIGYTDAGIASGQFRSIRGTISELDEHTFKYHIDFERLRVDPDVGAICVSRPTNPTGNVLTDEEMEHLARIALDNEVPLIIDSAYGTPFPDIIFTEATAFWSPNVIVCMSLSKVGLPGLRTGIIIADQPVIEAIAGINAILNLATCSAGPSLALDLVTSGEILHMSRAEIRPFYERKARATVAQIEHELRGFDFSVHEPEGAFFLWLWLKGMPISADELYQRLKRRGVLVISGHHFFPGLEGDDWSHKHECIRINYSQDDDTVRRGIEIIADEVRRAYREAA